MRSDSSRWFGKMSALAALLFFTTGSMLAQTSVSPYSIFGNGERESGRFAQQLGMGGISAGLRDPLQINIGQPASYSKLKYTTIDIGGFYQETVLQDANQSASTATGGFNYFAIGLPLAKNWGMAFGLTPYSKIGYDVNASTSLPFSDATVNYLGNGGFDRVYLGQSYEIFNGFSLGVNGNYYFGTAERTTTVMMDDNDFYNVTQEESIGATGLSWDAGLQYTLNLGADSTRELVIGATYVPRTVLNGSLNDFYYTFTENSTGTTRSYKDTLTNINNLPVDVLFNSSYSLGFTFGGKHPQLVQYAWSFGADYQFLSRSELNNSSELRGEYTDGFRVSAGANLIPYFAFDLQRGSYFGQIDYRVGAFYENSGLMVGGSTIEDKGFTVGMGFPIGRRITSPNDVKLATLNVGMVFGQRGLTEGGNVQESYARFAVGLTLNDKWFTQFRYR